MDPCPVGQRGILGQVQEGLAKNGEADKGQLSSDTHCQVMAAHGQTAAGQNRGAVCVIVRGAGTSCPQGLAVKAVHYSSHHTVEVPSCSEYTPLVISFSCLKAFKYL